MNKDEILALIATKAEYSTIEHESAFEPNLALYKAKLKMKLFLIMQFSSVTMVSNLKPYATLELQADRAQVIINGDKIIAKNFGLR